MSAARTHVARSGATVWMDAPSFPTGMVTVLLRNPAGDVHDKVRCDSPRDAATYWRAFVKAANNGWRS